MTKLNPPARTDACLDPSVLRAYDLGAMPELMLERVAGHLADCRRCESVLESIRGAEDAFLRDLRQSLRDTPPTPVATVGETGAALAAQLDRLANILTGLGPLPRRFGAYQVLERLAVGGMSYVFKACQLRPNRLVALKLPHCAPLPGTDEFQRFQREIEAIAQLQHDHIVRIYECGEEEGLPYFSMEYMEQGSLAAKLAGSPLPEREAAQLVQTLARAVQFAHGRGIIHRDLKPANVLLGPDGAVKLTDFGLAKWLDANDVLTRSHAILGTAKYMAPEQARGDAKQIGPLTDVYGLGAILYECLTGRAPFQAPTQAVVLRMVESSPPVPPSKLRRGLCRNLEAICLKCLEKDPARRYASAERLANDLEHWLKHEPTEARPPRWPARVYRKARRHVLALSLMAALLIGLVAIPVLDPERPIRQIERKLANRQPVTLIGETGKPAWFRMLVGSECTQVSQGRDNTFSVYSWGFCLLELVRDPHQDRYCLQAQIRHEDSSEASGEVGLFLAQRTFPSSSADIHIFTQLSFNDVNGAMALYNRLVPPQSRKNTPPPKGNYVYLFPRILSVAQQTEIWNQKLSGAGVQGAPFEAAGVSRGPWHRFEVVTTPENLRAFRDGQLIGELPVSAINKRMGDALARRIRDRPDDLSLRGIATDFQPRGSLGFYIFKGSAHFRLVRIVPEADQP